MLDFPAACCGKVMDNVILNEEKDLRISRNSMKEKSLRSHAKMMFWRNIWKSY
ncbi:MAG TPA: hypothetical protein GX501_02510 [Clostridiaceae bacterium]|nr:hypothetical protein [Clostridiaceae bacterium]